jgi:hypothetical protein
MSTYVPHQGNQLTKVFGATSRAVNGEHPFPATPTRSIRIGPMERMLTLEATRNLAI